MRAWRTTLVLSTILFVSGARALDQGDFEYWRHAEYTTSKDRSRIQPALVDTMARKLNVNWSYQGAVHLSDRRSTFSDPFVPGFTFFAFSPRPDDSMITYSDATLGRYVYGFGVAGVAKKNTELFLMSVYRQELDPVYRDTLSRFRTLSPVDREVFLRRNWLSSGYAMGYLPRNSPFLGSGRWMTGFGYYMDVVTLAAVALGAVAAKSPAEKAAVIGIGLSGNIAYKILMIPLGTSVIRTHNNVAKSGYKVPLNP